MLDDWISAVNRRLPAASYEARQSFVEVAPWLALLSAVLGLLLGGRASLLIGLAQSLIAGDFLPFLGVGSLLYLLFAISPLMALASIPGLRSRRKWGWGLFAASVLIDLVLSLLRLDLFGIAFGAVFFYFLLQVYFEYDHGYWR